jgi:hypothetical protein
MKKVIMQLTELSDTIMRNNGYTDYSINDIRAMRDCCEKEKFGGRKLLRSKDSFQNENQKLKHWVDRLDVLCLVAQMSKNKGT